MKIKKETLTKSIKCANEVGALKKKQTSNSNHESHTKCDVLSTPDLGSLKDKSVSGVKSQNASGNNASGPWQSVGILRQALLSKINSSEQIDKADLSMNVDSVLPKIQDLSPMDKLPNDLPPVSVSNNPLSHDSFSPSEFVSSMTSLPTVTSHFTSLSFGSLSSNPLSSSCPVPTQESSLPLVNQIPTCGIHQTSLQNESNSILSNANDSVSSGGKPSTPVTSVESMSSSLVSPVPSYTGASSNLVCQTFASLTSKDSSVAVYSSIPKAESSPSALVQNIQKTVPLPPMSEVKSSLSNQHTLCQAQNKTSGDLGNKVSLDLTNISPSANQSLNYDSIPSNQDGNLNTVKLDEQSNSTDFNGESSLSSEAVKFNTDVVSDISSSIVIPVSSDVILTKIDSPNSGSHQDISHIITIPLPAGTIYNSSLIPMPLPLPNSIPPGSSVPITPTIVSNLPYSLAGITNAVPNQCWQTSAVTLSTTNTQISTSVTSSLPVTVMSVAPSVSSLSNNNNNNVVHFTSNSVSLPSSQVVSTTVRTMPQDPVCYTVQSPAEILSQLSKAGVFPTMSSSQVSSVLSALGTDSHTDMESDSSHHNEIIANQVLSNEKVSTLTQTDSMELNILQQDEKIIQLLSGQQLLEHTINGSQMIMPSTQTANVNSEPSLNNSEVVTGNVGESKQISSPFPRIVAMVLNAPPISSEKLASSNVNSVGAYKRGENRELGSMKLQSEHTTASPRDNLRDFLVLPSNSKPQRKRPKKTSALREMLLGGDNTSPDKVKQSGKGRGRSKKVNNGSAVNAVSDFKNVKNDENSHSSFQGIVGDTAFSKEAECYKCKRCPFLSLEETSMLMHLKEKHCSEEQSLNTVRQELKCPGCANVFFTINSLEVHLKQDHQVNTPDLKAITSSAIRVATESNTKLSQAKKKRKKPVGRTVSINQNGVRALTYNEDLSISPGPSNCNMSALEPSGALIFSTNGGNECDILPGDQKICVKNLSSNVLNSVDNSVLSFENISVSNSKNSEYNASQERRSDIENGNLNPADAHMVNSVLLIPKGETSADNKADEKVNDVAQKRKRGRPKGSKSSSLIAGMMGDKDDSQSPKKTNSGHRCNIDNCAVTMRSPENIEYHRSCHLGAGYRCPECNHTHCHWNGMSTHLWRVHMVDMELYTCDQCNYKTVSYAKLINLHKWIHGSERPFLCDSCGKGFKNRKQLRNHTSIHQPKQTKLGECEICGRAFTNSRMLRMHLDNVHNKLRPHLCNYCGYSASSVGSLKMHMRKHTGEKPFRCNLCDYCTADHNSLRRHKMRHTGDKPYKCPHCSYACIQSSTYKAHLKTKHPGMDDGLMFSCNICAFRSVKVENYIAHLAEHKSDLRTLPVKRNVPEKGNVQEKFDVEEQSDSVIQLVGHIENGTNERFSIEKLSGLDSGCDMQMALESDFETEEITGDISEAELITGDLDEPQDFKICENDLKIKSHPEDLHSTIL